ncbi:MAG: hypothetical protein HAW66_01860 [Shewanella sp.]|nr:hypothetical protein [Shewanella sp.]
MSLPTQAYGFKPNVYLAPSAPPPPYNPMDVQAYPQDMDTSPLGAGVSGNTSQHLQVSNGHIYRMAEIKKSNINIEAIIKYFETLTVVEIKGRNAKIFASKLIGLRDDQKTIIRSAVGIDSIELCDHQQAIKVMHEALKLWKGDGLRNEQHLEKAIKSLPEGVIDIRQQLAPYLLHPAVSALNHSRSELQSAHTSLANLSRENQQLAAQLQHSEAEKYQLNKECQQVRVENEALKAKFESEVPTTGVRDLQITDNKPRAADRPISSYSTTMSHAQIPSHQLATGLNEAQAETYTDILRCNPKFTPLAHKKVTESHTAIRDWCSNADLNLCSIRDMLLTAGIKQARGKYDDLTRDQTLKTTQKKMELLSELPRDFNLQQMAELLIIQREPNPAYDLMSHAVSTIPPKLRR